LVILLFGFRSFKKLLLSQGVGKVSSYVGEIYDEKHQVSVLLSSSRGLSSDRIADLLELPTALKAAKIVTVDKLEDLSSGFTEWQGKLPKKKLLGVGYDYEACTYTALPWHKQLIIDGKICCSDYIDGSGACLFDRSKIVPVEIASSSASTVTNNANSEECPVCSFMKKGSCNSQFLTWKDCIDTNDTKEKQVQQCEKFKESLASCMVKDEYYDIFVAKFE